MTRITTKNKNGKYTSDLSKEELLNILGALEDAGVTPKQVNPLVGTTRWVVSWSSMDRKYFAERGTILKVFNSKKEGIRFDISLSGFIDRVSEQKAFHTEAEAQQLADQRNEENSMYERRTEFLKRVEQSAKDCTLDKETAQTEEEKQWLADWAQTHKWKSARGCAKTEIRHLADRLHNTVECINTYSECYLLDVMYRFMISWESNVKEIKITNHLNQVFNWGLPEIIIPDITEDKKIVKDYTKSFFAFF